MKPLSLPSLALALCAASIASELAAAEPETNGGRMPLLPGLGMKLVWIQPGTFTMGSPEGEPGRRGNEGPQTVVTLSQGYWLGAFEVTNGQWSAMMGSDVVALAHAAQVDDRQYLISGKTMMYLRDFAGVKKDDDPRKMVGNTDADVPIIWASWDDAMAFCRKFTESERAAGRLPNGYSYRLPTEAEWEFACRAGSQNAVYAGKMELLPNGKADVLEAIAWYAGNSGQGYVGHAIDSSATSEKKEVNAGKGGPRTVGTKRPNAWGLYDMLGNAAEWCMDWDGSYPGGSVTDWKGPASGKYHVRRGGGWSSTATLTRAAYRNWHEPTYRWSNLGFRVALAPDEPAGTH